MTMPLSPTSLRSNGFPRRAENNSAAAATVRMAVAATAMVQSHHIAIDLGVQETIVALEVMRHEGRRKKIRSALIRAPRSTYGYLPTAGKSSSRGRYEEDHQEEQDQRPQVGEETLQCVLDALRDFPALSKLVVEFDEREQFLSLPAVALVAYLSRSYVNKLTLKHVRISGTREHIDYLATTMQEHDELTQLHLIHCRGAYLDPILQACADARGIQRLILENTGIEDPSTVVQLCQGSLRALTLKNVPGLDNKTIAQVAQRGLSLESLTIESCSQLGDVAGVALATMLQTNTTLQSVSLNFDFGLEQCASAMAHALSVNQTLSHLTLRVAASSAEGSAAAGKEANVTSLERDLQTLAFALRKNRTLTHFRISLDLDDLDLSGYYHGYNSMASPWLGGHGGDDSLDLSAEETLGQRLRAPFEAVLQDYNHTLQDLDVNDGMVDVLPNIDYQDEVEFYLKLNRTGARQILQKEEMADTKEWVDAIISQKDSVDVVFYLLSCNPSICEWSNQHADGSHQQTPTSSAAENLNNSLTSESSAESSGRRERKKRSKQTTQVLPSGKHKVLRWFGVAANRAFLN